MASDGRTALVTGAARGIGLAIARRLAADGLRVALLDLDRDRVEAAARDVGAGAIALVADVTRSAEVDAAVQATVERWGRLDVLVNNAGITGRSFPIWELDDEDWERVIVGRPHERLLLLPGSGPGDAPAGIGTHRQHRLDRRQGGEPDAGARTRARRPA